jgi:hypothetical protein
LGVAAGEAGLAGGGELGALLLPLLGLTADCSDPGPYLLLDVTGHEVSSAWIRGPAARPWVVALQRVVEQQVCLLVPFVT